MSAESISAFAVYSKKFKKHKPKVSNGNGPAPKKVKKRTVEPSRLPLVLSKSRSSEKSKLRKTKISSKSEVGSESTERKKLKPSTKSIVKTKVDKSVSVVKNRSDRKRKLRDDDPPLLVPIYPNINANGTQSARKNLKGVTSVPLQTNASLEGLKLFKWLISPLSPKQFFDKYWEAEVLHIKRESPNYYAHLLSSQKLDDIFREFPLYYNRNVDVVSYENGVKQVHNEEGRVIASALYDYYSNGCSIRVLNPQTYDQKVHLLIATLQEYFGTMVGANVYLTPPESQGFAPHYDDIEAFIVQLEGRKHWKLYKPSGSDVLARYSSPNLNRESIGEPFMEVTLDAGDLLYFPRGTIHEGRTDPEQHSLHITVSVYQRTSYVDLLEHIIPEALKRASNSDVSFRKGLPINCLSHLGYVNRNTKSEVRDTVTENVRALMKTLINHIDVDQGVDKLGRRFMYDSMPPVLSKAEAIYTSKYDGDYMRDGRIFNRCEIGLDTEIRLVRYHCLHLDFEEDAVKIYYNTENAKVYHGEEEQFLTLDKELVGCIEKLQNAYPDFVQVEDLPIDDDTAKAQLVSDLWERGLLVTNGHLTSFGDDASEESESSLSE